MSSGLIDLVGYVAERAGRRHPGRQTSVEYQRPYRPLPVALANRLGRALERFGIRARLEEDSLVAAARKETGLSDLGDDVALRRRLRILLQSLNDEARLHPVGRLMARQNIIRLLTNRLRIEDALKREPRISQTTLEPPVFIAGLQRTGTTLLHRLMSCDTDFRYLAAWEAINPAPLTGRGNGANDPRIRAAELAQLGLRYLAPDFFAIHPIDAQGPEEDCLLFDFDFFGQVPEATQRVSRFSAWLEHQDHAPAYRFIENVLRYLQFQRPGGHWLLKTPQHLENLDSLLEVFPQARIIQTHRDPVTTLASLCSMLCHARGVFSDHIDVREVAGHWLAKTARMIECSMYVRNKTGRGKFLDVSYYDLAADPLAEIRRIYDWLGKELNERTVSVMRQHLNHNPRHKYGVHRYGMEQFGLDEDKVERLFAEYRRRFGIPRE